MPGQGACEGVNRQPSTSGRGCRQGAGISVVLVRRRDGALCLVSGRVVSSDGSRAREHARTRARGCRHCRHPLAATSGVHRGAAQGCSSLEHPWGAVQPLAGEGGEGLRVGPGRAVRRCPASSGASPWTPCAVARSRRIDDHGCSGAPFRACWPALRGYFRRRGPPAGRCRWYRGW